MIHVVRMFRSVVRISKFSVCSGLATLVLLAGAAQAGKAQLTGTVGTTSATQTINVTITTAGETASTPADAFLVLTQGSAGLDFNFVSGGTCAVSQTYAAEAVCTVEYTFRPKFSGVRYGAVQLKSSAGVVLGTAFISGIGTGPQPIFPQTMINTLPGTYNQPRAIALDGAGDIYVANFGGKNILKIPVGCATSSCVTALGGGFGGPAFVAVDGAGNIYVADFTNSVVDEMPAGCLSASCVTPVGGGFSNVISVRVDGSGDVFVADFGSSSVKKIPPGCTTSACVVQLGQGFNHPQDVALDGSGNIYVADYDNNLVKSMPASCNSPACTVTTLGGGFSLPSGVAVDGNGNVYVGDANNNAVKVMTPNCTPANASTCVTNVGIVFSAPIGVALDGAGDLYVADNGNNAIREIPRATGPSITFASVNHGSSSAIPQTVTLTNYGNQPLSIAVPSSGMNPSVSSNFSLATTGPGACPSVSAAGSPGSLAANASCTLNINFNPIFPDNGTVSGSVVVTDNSANVAGSSQTIALSGSATDLAPTITSISPNDGLPAGGTSVIINGSSFSAVTAVHFGSALAGSLRVLSDTEMTVVSPVDTVGVVDIQATNSAGLSAETAADQFTYTNALVNTITFPALANGTLVGTPASPAASATSGQPVTYATNTPAVCTISGTSITYVGPGTCTISASQSATGSYAAATPVSQSLQVLMIENVGTKSATLTATLTFTTAVALHTAFTTSVTTLGATGLDFNVATGGTCVSGTAYAVGATCTVNYTFKPLYTGVRSGGISLSTGSGTSEVIVASVYLGGEGLGPQVIYPAAAIQLNTTQGAFAIDGSGTLYVLGTTGSGFFITVTPAGCLTSACQTQITSLPGSATQDLAVDGIGNIYLADAAGRVYVLPPGCRSSCFTTLAVVPEATSIAADMAGNLYVAGSNGLTEILAGCTTSNCSVLLGGGGSNLTKSVQTMAVDFAGNVYFTNFTTHAVSVLTPNCVSASCATALGGSSFSGPTGVAVDPNGNVYVADMGHSKVYMMPPSCLSSSCVQAIFSIEPYYGILLDAQGNMYVSGILDPNGVETLGIFELTRSRLPSFVFATTPNGETSQPQTTSITNYGNQPLVLSVPPSGDNPGLTANFDLQTGVSGECPSLTTSSTAPSLAANATCSLPIVFAPVAAAQGTATGTLTLTDDNLNATLATQVLSFSGSVPGKPTVSAVSPSTGSVAGTSVTITGTNFFAGATVSFGGTAATGITVNSTTSMTVTAPAHAAGTVDVTVTVGTATSATSSADHFTFFVPPSVTGISPIFGPPAGGTSVTITGTNFVSGAAVSFGGAPANSVTVNSSTSITAISPLGSGKQDVTVTGNGVASATSSADQFNYLLNESVGSTSATQTVMVTVTTAGTPGAIDVLTTGQPNLDFTLVSGGTCAAGTAYAANATCTVKYTFKPGAPGIRLGAVQLVASGGASVLGTAMISGLGTGPAVMYPTNQTIATLGSGFSNPNSMAVDAAGNVFVADFTNNAVKEIVAVNGSIPANPTIRMLGSGIYDPTGIAVDGAGNVYVADNGDSAVKEIVAVGGSIPTSNPSIVELDPGGFYAPVGIAVDGAGNVYVSDQYNNTVQEIATGSSSVALLASGFNNPQGIAVDGFGNVFVADYGNNAVKEIVSSGNVVTISSAFNKPNGVTLDAAGDVYVADGIGTVSEIVAVNGSIPSSSPTILTLGSGFTMPAGVAVDGAGNVYVADSGQSKIFEIGTATATGISFATTNIGSTSSPQSFSLQNIGNESLTLPAPGSGKNPAITSSFILASTCPIVSAGGAAGMLAEGALCTESISFAPAASGLDSGSLTFTDNNLNISSATQAIGLSGRGIQGPTVTAISPVSGSVAGGTIVTITGTNFASGATVSFGGTAATGVTAVSATQLTVVSPAGNAGAVDVTVTTSVGTSTIVAADKFTYTPIASTINFPALANAVIGAIPPTLAATSNSPAAITYASTTTSVCSVASGVITDVGGGTCSITASQTASGNFAAATPVSQSFTVTVPLVFVAGSGKIESLASDGSVTSAATGGGGVGAAVDSSGDVWSIDAGGAGISRFTSLGAGQNDYNTIGLTGASALAIDGNSQIWVANGNGNISVLSNAGAVVSTVQGSTTVAPSGISIDISGNVWIANATTNSIDEVIGGAAPALPLSTAVMNNKTGARP